MTSSLVKGLFCHITRVIFGLFVTFPLINQITLIFHLRINSKTIRGMKVKGNIIFCRNEKGVSSCLMPLRHDKILPRERHPPLILLPIHCFFIIFKWVKSYYIESCVQHIFDFPLIDFPSLPLLRCKNKYAS